jgi:5'-nucleotidase / UDP-sugar diphosphatase
LQHDGDQIVFIEAKLKSQILLSSLLILTLGFLPGCSKTTVTDALQDGRQFSVTIAHLNDTHSHLDSDQIDLQLGGKKTRVELGGFPAIASKVKQLKRDNKHFLLLHAGDALSGTLYYSLFKGEAEAHLMNMLQFDAFAIGNHEFDDGNDTLASFLKKSQLPAISTNIITLTTDDLFSLIKPYLIREIDGEQVGIIGLTTARKTKESSRPGDSVSFSDEITSTRSSVDALRQKGVNKIILLSHYGYENDLALAAEVEGVDVIIGGDSHSLLGDFSQFGLSSSGPYPTRTVSPSGDPVCVAQAWQYGRAIGKLDVTFDATGIVTSCDGQTSLLLGDSFKRKNKEGKRVEIEGLERIEVYQQISGSKLAELVKDDPDVAAVLAAYSQQLEPLKLEKIGTAGETLLHNRIPGTAYNGVNLPLGSDVAPIVAKSFYELSLRANAAITNAGGVRISIGQGDITVDTAYTLLPFSNTLIELEMTGTEIKSILEDAVDNALYGNSSGAFPYAYGLRYTISAGPEKGKRVTRIEIKKRKTGAWTVLESDQLYVVVTNSYIAAGKDGYTTFKTVQDKKGRAVDTYLDYAMSFVDYVKARNAEGQPVMKLDPADHPIKHFSR